MALSRIEKAASGLKEDGERSGRAPILRGRAHEILLGGGVYILRDCAVVPPGDHDLLRLPLLMWHPAAPSSGP